MLSLIGHMLCKHSVLLYILSSFDTLKYSFFIKSNLSTFSFLVYAFGVLSRSPLLRSRSLRASTASSESGWLHVL